jgi:hypothetical protein
LSDSFIDAALTAGVTWFPWVAAIVEILGDLLFGAAGVAALVTRGAAGAPKTVARTL